MKAIVCTAYGPPEVLQLRDVPKPSPRANEVLTKVHAGGVSPSDCAFRKGDPFLVRLFYGVTKPKLAIQGVEFAGEIEAIGNDVTTFQPGDRVFGISPDTFGAHAEYLCLPEDKPIALILPTITYAEMAGIADGAPTALIFLRDVAKVRPGQKVLINGASGAVGVYSVQLAKAYGAEVTGVCSGKNMAMVQSLGADATIDYTRTDFTRTGQQHDVIFDAVGKRSFSECKQALTDNGLYLSTVPTAGVFASVLWTSLVGKKKSKFVTAGLMQSRATVEYIAGLVKAGTLKAVIDRIYPLEQTAEAHRYVETERKQGNVILMIDPSA